MKFSLMDSDRSSLWFSFLEEESLGLNGLLCFYDVRKSREVAYCCTVLVEALSAFLDRTWMNGDPME